MPGRCLFLQESDALLTTPRALNNPEINIFDKSPGADMDIEEWQDWYVILPLRKRDGTISNPRYFLYMAY
jgi:hypothetical protein